MLYRHQGDFMKLLPRRSNLLEEIHNTQRLGSRSVETIKDKVI